MIREHVVPKAGGATHGPSMTPGVRAAGLVFFSAIRGNGPDGMQMPDNTEAQARQAFENLRLLLEGVGATFDHVVKVTLYLEDLKYRTEFHKVWSEIFGDNPPARMAVGVENADVSATKQNNCHFVLDVVAVDPRG